MSSILSFALAISETCAVDLAWQPPHRSLPIEGYSAKFNYYLEYIGV